MDETGLDDYESKIEDGETTVFIIIREFRPRAGPSLKEQEPWLQFG